MTDIGFYHLTRTRLDQALPKLLGRVLGSGGRAYLLCGEVERAKALDAGYDLDRVLHTDDLVTGDNCFFVATGVTSGDLLRGVRYRAGGAYTQSIVMRSKSGTIRLIDSYHRLEKLALYSLVDFDGGRPSD